MTGKTFFDLTVLNKSTEIGNAKKPIVHWTCKCICGNIVDVPGNSLRTGSTKSCGCGMKATQFSNKHQMCFTHEYNCWQGMKKRCKNSDGKHLTYVLKNITVSHEWESSFENFYNDMGPAPSHEHTIDRMDNSKGYYKGNCRWATQKQQNRNYDQNRILTYNGRSMCVTEWAEFLNIDRGLIFNRLRYGWSVEKALTTPKTSLPARNIPISI